MEDANKSQEISNACRELGIPSSVLTGQEAVDYINFVIERYRPSKTTGHVAIHHNSVSVPLQNYEFTYSKFMDLGPAYIFFEQYGVDKNIVVIVEQGNRLGEVFENSYGMEYFVSNRQADFLLAINWYVIEGAGSALNWLSKLQ